MTELPDGADAATHRPHVVMAIGDSITLGVNGNVAGASGFTGGYRAPLFAMRPGLVFVGRNDSHGLHEGYGGKRTDEIKTIVDPIIDADQPDTILLIAGTNDLAQGVSQSQVTMSIVDLATTFRAHPSVRNVLVGTIPTLNIPSPGTSRVYNDGLSTAFSGTDIQVVDVCADVIFPADFGDAYHPNDGGYARMAARWATAIEATP
jgi:lysophospholipase L1-like esterase